MSLLVIGVLLLVTNSVMVAFGIEVPAEVGIPPVQVMNTSPASAVYSSARISGLFAEPVHCISVDCALAGTVSPARSVTPANA